MHFEPPRHSKLNRLYQTIQNHKGEILNVKRSKSAETNLSEGEWEFVRTQLLLVNTTREIEAGTQSIIPSLSVQGRDYGRSRDYRRRI